jgi:recombination protein RecT
MSNQQLAVTNYDKIKALANNAQTIERFAGIMGSKRGALSYISSAMLAVANSPELMECTPSSVFNSVMRAAALNLSCDPSTKQAHIVAYKNNKKGTREAQFIPGYVGLNQLAHRTGKYRFLNVGELYEGQQLEINQLTGASRIEGKRTSNVVVGYFHYFELFNGFTHLRYMSVEELKQHGERYAPYNPLWKKDFPAMAKKTVTRLHLLHDGILNPHDKEILNEMADERMEGESIQGEVIDSSFSDSDDETAAMEAAQRKIDEANRPKRDNDEMLSEFGYEPNEPKTESDQHAPIAPIPSVPIISPDLEAAMNRRNSKGVQYGELETGELVNMVNSMVKANNAPDADKTGDEYKLRTEKIAAIRLILADRKTR